MLPSPSRGFFIPETVQSSALDCGPASLKALLDGYGLPVGYGRLREACQTDIDGTSIDMIEEAAIALGLEAEQIMVPADHLLLREARTLPAIVVVVLPNGLTHFVVVWRKVGRWLQVMDPAVGRRWLGCRRFLQDVFVHEQAVPASGWREWAGTEDFLGALRVRMRACRIEPPVILDLIGTALADPGWKSMAALDAAVRMTGAMAGSAGLRRGSESARMTWRLFELGRAAETPEKSFLPRHHWSVWPAPEDPESLLLRGAVLVRVLGRRTDAGSDGAPVPDAAPGLAAARAEKSVRLERKLFPLLSSTRRLAIILLLAGLSVRGLAVFIESLLFRDTLGLGTLFAAPENRTAALAAILIFLFLMLLLNLGNLLGLMRLGRSLESQVRTLLLRKIPRIADRYFHSRLVSDMAERSHSLHKVRDMVFVGGQAVLALSGLTFTALGLIWLAPGSAGFTLLAGLAAVAVPLAVLPFLAERDMRVRTHTGALGRFFLDGLIGLAPIRAHHAESPIRRSHAALLQEWTKAGGERLGISLTGEIGQFLLGTGLAIVVIFHQANSGLDPATLLLIAFLALSLPAMGQVFAQCVQQYPLFRNILIRLYEPLEAPEDEDIRGRTGLTAVEESGCVPCGVAVEWQGVDLRVSRHEILHGITLSIPAGTHAAVVGPSGAGKSSLVGLLLGWHRASAGRVAVDGKPLEGRRLAQLRSETAWVDPAVQIWNRPMSGNLTYGMNDSGGEDGLEAVADRTGLNPILASLPEGWRTPLGENGALVSGGEGMRVRLARALLRGGVRLAVFDEPFRGLEREERRRLLNLARDRWKQATFICVTHDIADTGSFDRVIVMEDGRITEDGSPAELRDREGSRYRALLDAERTVRSELWEAPAWRRFRLEDGRLTGRDDPREAR
jgi:ABC-type bacteriocin/lantibiotic exporter with double-glycine peptidase domain